MAKTNTMRLSDIEPQVRGRIFHSYSSFSGVELTMVIEGVRRQSARYLLLTGHGPATGYPTCKRVPEPMMRRLLAGERVEISDRIGDLEYEERMWITDRDDPGDTGP